jgi:hypothetical protein
VKIAASAPFHRTTADKGIPSLIDGLIDWMMDGSMADAAEEDTSIQYQYVAGSKSAVRTVVETLLTQQVHVVDIHPSLL